MSTPSGAFVFSALLLAGFCAGAQTEYQTQVKTWQKTRDDLKQRARKALAGEAARDKAGDCPNADTTLAQRECLQAEDVKTQANYKAFTSALRAILASPYPEPPGAKPVSGPTGPEPTAAQRAVEFDRLEAAFQAYRELAQKAAYNEYAGGTLAPVAEMEASQELLRSHMRELARLYDNELSNR